jgi:alkylation response protein AidB-like acyl-CoA dehydrogenase
MDLDFTEEQEMLREMVRGVCQEYAPLDVVRKMEDDPAGYPVDLWKQLAEVGVLGIVVPEAWGGSAQSVLDCAVVYEEFGRALCPSPHFVSSVLSAGALLRAGSDEQKQRWLPGITSGEAILTPAWLEPNGGFGPEGVQLSAILEGERYVLNGSKRHVAFASAANCWLVPARTGEGREDIDLLLVDPESPGIEIAQQFSLASDTQYSVRFDGVRVPVSHRIGGARSGWKTWDAVMQEGVIMLAAQAMGGAERSLEMTVEFAKERHQFDKPLAAFQAISHYLADAATAVSGGQTLVYEAAWAASEGKPIDRLASMAKLFACQTFRDVTAMAEQVYGGVGFTVEYDIQLYFRRAKQLQLSWWDSRHLEERVAGAVLDSGAVGDSSASG